MHSLVFLSLAVLGQPRVGPVDAFQANMAATKIDVIYTSRAGQVADLEILRRLRSWDPGPIAFPVNPAWTKLTRWVTDGMTQRVQGFLQPPENDPTSRSQFEALVGSRNVSVQDLGRLKHFFDVVWDEETKVEQRSGDPDLQVHQDGGVPGLTLRTAGPFIWWGTVRYPSTYRLEYSEGPAIATTSLAGYQLVVATYARRYSATSWGKVEVFHDPAIGYLPRFCRSLGVIDSSKSLCQEYYLREARLSPSGGFYPVDSVEVSFACASPSISHLDSMQPIDAYTPFQQMGIRQLEASKIDESVEIVALDRLQDVKKIAAVGGFVPRGFSGALTLAAIKSKLGPKLLNRDVKLPTYDVEEVERFNRPAKTDRTAWVVGSATFAILLIGLVLYRRRGSSSRIACLLFMVVLTSSGCSSGGGIDPAAKSALQLKFDRQMVLIPREQSLFRVGLEIRNVSSLPTLIKDVDGGCSCRQVDKTILPVELASGESTKVSVSMTSAARGDLEQYRYTVLTDQGVLEGKVTLTVFAEDAFSPQSVSAPALRRDDAWSFELIHRRIHEKQAGAKSSKPSFPSTVSAKLIDETRGEIPNFPTLAYQDSKYIVELGDARVGMFREVIALRDSDQRLKLELPMVWNRVDFVSLVPNTILLGTRPVRAFLRCPDETVELAEVVSAPPGVKAVITGPRELTVSLADDAPSIIDATIELKSSARNVEPVRLPVRRFSVATTSESGAIENDR